MPNLEIEYPKKPSKYSQEEWEARVNLAACYRLTDYYGWDQYCLQSYNIASAGY